MNPSSKGHPSDYRAFAQAELYTPARMASLAWARSNFTQDHTDIVAVLREGSRLVVARPQETLVCVFKNEMDAKLVERQLPCIVACQNPHAIGHDIDSEELNRQQNFGQILEERNIAVTYTPAPFLEQQPVQNTKRLELTL